MAERSASTASKATGAPLPSVCRCAQPRKRTPHAERAHDGVSNNPHYGIILATEWEPHVTCYAMKELSLLTTILLQLDSLLASAVVIVAFSLLAYIALQNWHTAIARALCVLLAGIVIVFGGDVLLGQAQADTTIQFLLRAQWLGIVCIPAGYIHLSDALLTYSAVADRRRRWLVAAGYLASLAFFGLASSGDLLLRDGIKRGPLARMGAGPLFWLFALYFGLASVGGLLTALHVRRIALTPTLRRRLAYLGATFLGPGMAVFPYLVIAGT